VLTARRDFCPDGTEKDDIFFYEPLIGCGLRVFEDSSKFSCASFLHIPHDLMQVEQAAEAVIGEGFWHRTINFF
jgi:hypothetical protein